MPLMFGPKAQVRAALEAAGIPHTYVVSYGFASYWANGLGELGQKNRVPPSPSTSNKVPFYGTGRTKCAPPLSCLRTPCLVYLEAEMQSVRRLPTLAANTSQYILLGVKELLCACPCSCAQACRHWHVTG